MRSIQALLFTVLLTASLNTMANDFDAKAYVAGPCSKCHGSEMYTRPNRKVNSLAALGTQVRMCDSMLGTRLFNDDIAALVDYLNKTYYKFK